MLNELFSCLRVKHHSFIVRRVLLNNDFDDVSLAIVRLSNVCQATDIRIERV